mmetsp:Transcript_15802/g.24058  ORF Transcript_15802/g.24058 Transcript_15802/m.24058 type:complete len:327 (+) Transcript_15802:99-1079(+)|eukprot:CAMPEP_0118687942 /NCGR_PEP_ID=MMETSP0800-20121206/8655_1 /TAXON_ID=210618 ORGANISM="Striatella unipunctata, Strain CCMP2910" /NCGR_SAMPLE_ID=MMETSP0800 /ASSEMBLY_ACC=CAM_ASM_000638 /LENGTH=326 /DNA_ID=CAMNT_0006585167 /DNA_START=86 /DNA_END=1066 /DNA_ORIENTATION=+
MIRPSREDLIVKSSDGEASGTGGIEEAYFGIEESELMNAPIPDDSDVEFTDEDKSEDGVMRLLGVDIQPLDIDGIDSLELDLAPLDDSSIQPLMDDIEPLEHDFQPLNPDIHPLEDEDGPKFYDAVPPKSEATPTHTTSQPSPNPIASFGKHLHSSRATSEMLQNSLSINQFTDHPNPYTPQPLPQLGAPSKSSFAAARNTILNNSMSSLSIKMQRTQMSRDFIRNLKKGAGNDPVSPQPPQAEHRSASLPVNPSRLHYTPAKRLSNDAKYRLRSPTMQVRAASLLGSSTNSAITRSILQRHHGASSRLFPARNLMPFMDRSFQGP